jgi:glycosyltransferase involved in cell wall biosynthesis
MRAEHDISVVICAYTEERWEALLAAVASVHAQRLPPREIIVVIDHNSALLERVRAHISGVTAIENHEPRGLSGARNSGIAASQGSVIAFMDEDAIAATDWLERLAAPYADERVLGVGGAIEPLWLSGRPGWFPVRVRLGGRLHLSGHAAGDRAAAQPDRLQYVAAARGLRGRG